MNLTKADAATLINVVELLVDALSENKSDPDWKYNRSCAREEAMKRLTAPEEE